MHSKIDQILKALRKGHIFLEASAGTGKTYTIVEIVTRLLEEYDISNFVIITFTEKAAGELQERIRKALEEKLKTNLSTEIRGHFSKQLEELPFANIGTIHSFCRNLLSRELEASNFFPFKTEHRDVSVQVKQVFDLFLEHKEKQAVELSREQEFIEFFTTFDVEILREFCEELLYKSNFEKINLPPQANKQELNQNYKSLIRELALFASELHLNSYLNSELSYDLLRELQEAKILKKDYSLNQTTFKAYKDSPQFEKYSIEFQTIKALLDYSESFENILNLIQFYNEWVMFYKEIQEKENFISTEEVIVLTDSMLNNKKVRNTLCESLKFIIVDECQDTDPKQFSILDKLVNSNSKYPKLILVGDKKQSIYRFRNADLETVNYYIHKLVPQKNIFVLDTSYRSRQTLNQFFNELFSSSRFEEFKLQYSKVQTGREDEIAKTIEPSVFYSFQSSAEEKQTAERIRLENSSSIVNFIQDLCNKEYFIWDKYQKTKRKVRYSDIAIFSHSNNDLKKIQTYLLSKNIPCSMYKENDFYSENLVSSLTYMLHSIENPSDTQSFLFCLGSPIFLVSVQALSKLSEENFLNYYSTLPKTEEYKELNKIFEAFIKAHEKRYIYPASFIIQEILEEFKVVPRLASGFEGRKNLTHLYQFYDLLNEMQYEKNMSFGELAREMRRLVTIEAEGEKRLDYEEKDHSQDTVKLMTIHASKGLEFPICILFTLFRNTSGRASNIFKTRHLSSNSQAEIEFQLKLNSQLVLKTLRFEEAKQQDTREENEEEARRMYVALTRARDFLFLPINFPHSRLTEFSKSFKESLNPKFMEDLANVNLAKPLETTQEIFEPSISSLERTESLLFNTLEYSEKLEKALKNIPFISKWEFVSYSKLHKEEQKAKVHIKAQAEPKEEVFRGVSQGRQFGLLCHKVFEELPLEKFTTKKKLQEELPKFCAKLYNEFGVRFESSEYSLETLVTLVKRALEFKYPLDSKRVSISKWECIQKEKKFYSAEHSLGDWILGTWDLLFMFEDKYYILDWKTDQQIGESLRAHCEQEYKYQIYLYSFVLLQNLAHVSKLTYTEVYEKKFGGMLFVFLRHLDKKGVYFVKPKLKEIFEFVNRARK